MKRSELEVGGAYYYDRSTDWAEPKYGGVYGRKAVVVNTKPYKIRKSTWGMRHNVDYVEDPKGNAVLVDVYREDYDGGVKAKRAAVPVTHLRGPWEQTRAAVEAAVKARDERQRAESQATEEAAARAQRLEEQAAALGLTGVSWRREYRGDVQVTMPLETLQVLLDAYATNVKEWG